MLPQYIFPHSYMTSIVVCRNTESAVIKARTSLVWASFKNLNFKQLLPSTVVDCFLLVPAIENPSEHALSPPELHHVRLEEVDYLAYKIDQSSKSAFTCPLALGSLRRVVYKDGAEFVFRLVELSDIQHTVSYELIETDATVNVSGVLHTIQLTEITETAETFISWTTEFSGDCDQHVYSDAKFKKLDAFKDFKRVFE